MIVTIPYVQGLLEPIKQLLERLKVEVRLRPNKTLCQILVQLKNKVLMEQQTGVIYSIPCHDCPKTCMYVRQAGRLLECKIKQYQHTARNGDTNTLAIAEHSWQEQHNINWPAAMILDLNQYLNSRLILELWHVYQQHNPKNRELGSLPSFTAPWSETKTRSSSHPVALLTVFYLLFFLYVSSIPWHLHATHMCIPCTVTTYLLVLTPASSLFLSFLNDGIRMNIESLE